MQTMDTEFYSEEVLNPNLVDVEQEVIVENEEDESELDLPKSAFTPINFSKGDRRIIDLYRSYKDDKDLDPRPSFQRGYVWDSNRATKLIESILLHVPLPLIYTAEEEGGTEVVIDGQQRLTTCFAFIDGFFPLSQKDEEKQKLGQPVRVRPFKLGKMKILSHLSGKDYKTLPPELKTTFQKYQLQIIKISKDSHPDIKFEIFERLNTGSVSLSDQEIRNCIYRGNYNDLLYKLAGYSNFQTMLGITNSASRMQDVELVLRFMAFNEVSHVKYNKKMKSFLSDHMRDRRNITDEKAAEFTKDFKKAADISFTVFGSNAFRRYSRGTPSNPNGKWEKAINKAVFDVIMYWFAQYEMRQIIDKKDEIKDAFIKLCLEDNDFNDAIMLGTADVSRVKLRFKKWGEALDKIISAPANERRAYSFSEKQALFNSDSKCSICKQQIEHLDDAEVDHLFPFSKGGATDNKNAQITHRYCNRSKGNR
jgi:hypothetical protein